MKKRLNQFFSILLVVCMLLSMMPAVVFAATPSTLYLKPNANWKVDGARFGAYFFQDQANTWASMTDSDGDGVYECSVPSGYSNVIFCRMDSGNATNSWDAVWNQTSDLVIPTNGTNCYTIASDAWSHGSGSWSTISTTVDYYLFGYINGANYGCEEDSGNLGSYKFSSGKLTATFDCDVYVGVKTADGNGNVTGWYMTEGYQNTATSVTLINTEAGIAVPEKLYVPGGIKVTFTVTANSDGTLTLSYTTTASSCQHLVYIDGVCKACGKSCSHSWSNGTCSTCGATCSHSWSASTGKCSACGLSCSHNYSSSTGKCLTCGKSCSHSWSGSKCSTCGMTCSHSWSSGKCSTCGSTCSHASHSTAGKCTTCGSTVSHSYSNGVCTVCGSGCTHSWSSGKCSKCGITCSHTSHTTAGKCTTCGSTVSHNWSASTGKCTVCSKSCTHASHNTSGKCTTCGYSVSHTWSSGKCSVCGKSCSHSWSSGKCSTCGLSCTHSWSSGKCATCGTTCSHSWSSGKCSTCGTSCSHNWNCSTCKTCGSTRDFYLFGFINGANYACEEDSSNLGSYKFTSNKLTVTFTSDSYVAVKTSDNASWYMTEGYDDTATSATLYNTAAGIASPDKVYVPGGIKVTFTITENSNDTLTLKYSVSSSSCQHLTHSTSGVCTACGESVDHSWSGDSCSVCGKTCTHSWSNGKCSTCGTACSHSWSSGKCATCGLSCSHSYSGASCTICGSTRDYYLFGFINGANYACEEDGSNIGSYKFTSNKLTVTFTTDSYVAVKTGDNLSWYMTEGYNASATSVTLYNTGSGLTDPNKMFVPGGVKVTFTLTVNASSDTLTLKYSVDSSSCQHLSHSTSGICSACGTNVGHSFSGGTCTVCGTNCSHSWSNGTCSSCGSVCSHSWSGSSCTTCGMTCSHKWNNGACSTCGSICSHSSHSTSGVCSTCGSTVSHRWSSGKCSVCGKSCSHSYSGGVCTICGYGCTHSWSSGKCSKCGTACTHSWSNGKCSICSLSCSHSWSNGYCSTCGSTCSHSYSGNTCTVCGYVKPSQTTKVYFSDTMGWVNITAYPWVTNGSSDTTFSGMEWPGTILSRNAEGYYVLEVPYVLSSGESLGLIFHNFNGAQTSDITIPYSTIGSGNTVYVKPNNYANGEGKYDCSVSNKESGIFVSPEVNGTSVTFRYSGSATKVYVAGSFNNWSTTANPMTKGSDGVFTTTITLAEGAHEYKFVVDGEWIADPVNGVTGGYDGNSMVTVGAGGNTASTTITVKFHFYRESGDYTDWDIWAWDASKDGSYTFSADPTNKGVITTITTDSTTGWLNYLVRKNDWSDQEFYNRAIYLCNVKSGTVHFFLNSGSAEGSVVLGNDVVMTAKPTYANLDYNSGEIWVKTPLPVTGTLTSAFSIVTSSGGATGISVTGVTLNNYGYSLTLSRKPTLLELHNLRVKVGGTLVSIETDGLFYSSGFANDYTYYGDDLGATWSASSTTFKVWAPTATGVSVMLYGGGNYGGDDWISTTAMTLGSNGVWSVTISGNLHGKYYNYLVNFPSYSCEANDPYARSTGANGDRGMILNLDATDPDGWENDVSPNVGMSYTDAIIYEMHIREMTIDSSSGVKDEWKGKFLGMTQDGTNYNGYATGLAHLKELGITHVQLMPVYDFASIDEYHLTDWQQYGWGYDPEHYNVPEGSYSTDPFNGEVRVNEFKEMVQTFHENGINVVMDVVYNHTFSGGDWCYNKIVPNYFSRFWAENNWSNGSGCGNDLATERSMARNYIVDSIMYWVEEYHVDGFRFDLAGLIDTQTINEITNTVHAKYPYVIFYGEGWSSGDTAVQDGHSLATKGNAWITGSMGFYNDSFRNDIAGDNGRSWGFATGDSGKADAIGNYFRASNGWSGSPSQTINYASAHDNYTLIDKIIISRNGAYWDQMVKMNNLSAAIYMMSSGIPYIYSGEELLREKVNEDGYRIENAHGTNDYVNKIRWSDLQDKSYTQVTDDYYGGLVEFRKNHAALRCNNGSDAWGYTSYHKINDHCIMFYVNGYPNYECSDGIVIIYNANESTQWVNIYDYGVPYGNWQACVHGMQAGVSPLWSTSDGSVGVEGLSTTILVLGDLVHEESVYNNQTYACYHTYHSQGGLCYTCGATVDHNFVNGYCSTCSLPQSAPDTVTIYYDNSTTAWGDVYLYAWAEAGGRTTTYTGSWPGTKMTDMGNNIFALTVPRSATNLIFSDNYVNQTGSIGIPDYTTGQNLYNADGTWGTYTATCYHTSHDQNGVCTNCGVTVAHSWSASTGSCTVCSKTCSHADHSTNGICTTCGKTVSHSWSNGKCSVCFLICDHTSHNTSGTCTNCGYSVGHTYYASKCSCGATCDYYLFGYINGANYGCEEDESNMGSYKFVGGKLTVTFASDSYVAVKTTGNYCWYMTEGYDDTVTTTTLYNTNSGISVPEKLFVPGGMEITFTLTVNSNDTLTLSYVADQSTCSHSYTSSVTTAATCETAGVKTYTCSNCGYSYTESIAATGHSYVSGKCTVCGAADPSYVAPEGDYVLVTDISQITDGGKFVIVANNGGTYYALGSTISSKISGVVVTVEGNVVTSADAPVWIIESVDGGVSLSNGTNYLKYSSSTNFGSATTAYAWVVAAGTDGFNFTASTSTRGLFFQISGLRFGAYASSYAGGTSYISDLMLFEYQGEEETPCTHSYTSKVTTAAGCETTGVKTYTCSKCGDSYTESIAATGHSYSASVTAPTCTTGGYTTYTCSACGDSYQSDATAATGHSYVSGTCTVCGGADPDYVEPTVEYMNIYFQNNWLWTDVSLYYWGSAAENPAWPGTAMQLYGNDGTYDIYVLQVPTDITGMIINGTGSNGADQSPDITSGWYDGICYYMHWNDGNEVGSEDIDVMLPEACDHSYTSKVTTAATCETAGVKTYTCSKCGNSYTESIAATGHTNDCVTVPATCQSYASYQLTCSKCGNYEVLYANDLANQVFAEIPSGMDASLFTGGGTMYRYRDYNEGSWGSGKANTIYYVESWPSGFSTSSSLYAQYDNIDDKVTAYENDSQKLVINSDKVVGYLYYHWCYTNSYYSKEYSTGSYTTFHAYYSTTEPSNYTCDYSDMSYKTSHSGCSNSDWYFVAEVYGQTYTVSSMVGGGWGEWSEWSTTAYTASSTREVETTTGYRYANASLGSHSYSNGKCSVCGAVDPNCTHSYTSKVTTAAGCETAGVRTYTCSLCGDSYTESIAATGHSYTSKVTTAAGCETAGVRTYTCSGCNGSYTESIAAIGHSYSSKVTTAATCETAGVKTFTCANCSGTYTEAIAALGHTYVGGTCSTCGSAEPVAEYMNIYFQNNWNWSDVSLYYWGSAFGNPAWPGTAMELYGNDGTYDIYVLKVPTDITGMIINGVKDDGGGTRDQTPNIESGWYDGICYYMTWNDGNATGSEDIDVILPAECSHSYSSKITTAAGCTTAGVRTYTCSKCGDSYTEAIAAAGHSYSGGSCTVCGAADPNYSTVTAPTITASTISLSFEDEILLNVYFTASNTADVVNYGLLTFSEKVSNPTYDTAIGKTLGYYTSGNYLGVTSPGIAAKKMGDKLYFAVYAELSDGSYAYSKCYSYAPSTYAYSLLSKSTTTDGMKSLIVAMLNYGAAAQTYFNYNTDNLVNANLTDEQKALVVDYNADMLDGLTVCAADKKGTLFGSGNTGFSKRTPSVNFEGAFSVNFYFSQPKATVGSDVTFYVWDKATYESVDTLLPSNAIATSKCTFDGTYYMGVVEGIAAKEVDETFYCAAVYTGTDGNAYVSGVIAYSLGYYLENQANGTKMPDFAKATGVYAYYAKTLFNA